MMYCDRPHDYGHGNLLANVSCSFPVVMSDQIGYVLTVVKCWPVTSCDSKMNVSLTISHSLPVGWEQ